MSRAHKTTNPFAVGIPIAAFLTAVVLLWNRAVGLSDLGIPLGLYLVTALGITGRALRAVLAVMGSMAVQGVVSLPFALGWALTGRFMGGLTGLLWGGLVRVFLLNHVTWSINSLCHFVGRGARHRRRVAQRVLARAPLARRGAVPQPPRLPHLRGPRLRRLELDPSAWVNGALERLGLAWNVVRITPERRAAKAA